MPTPITYKQFGEKTILIEWPARIQEDILYDIIRLKAAILDNLSEEIEDCIVSYNSLAVKYQSIFKNYNKTKQALETLYKTAHQSTTLTSYLWDIPVCYDTQFGIDLMELSKRLSLSVNEVIELHSKATYMVYFIGFLPGFLYLGGLDERLHIARKETPRLRVNKGSVAIGGHQTGVYPMQSAGGWHIIGSTPIHLFDLKKEQPCLAKSGDKIKFSPVSFEEYTRINKKLDQGIYELSKTVINA
ncbi:MAG: 5-oxoprolinase subunit PxpB [Chitinophagales bacterium]|nr:5-oxoprolinase subunit PxpB [Chitinophagales bacterium]